MIKEAVILAGGLGTRLQKVVHDVPKPLADIGGKPFLFYLFSYLEKQKIQRVIISSGYKYERIRQEIGDTFGNISVLYANEETPLGTGGGLRNALTFAESENLLVLNGDTYFPLDVQSFFSFFESREADIALAVRELDNTSRYGSVSVAAGGRITAFREKGREEPGMVNAGTYLLRRNILESFPPGKKFSFETDFLQVETTRLKIFAFPVKAYFIDIGIPEDYQKACLELPQITQ